jgi:LacI family transcriptional regulator
MAITIRDIAKEAGVSVTTVSRVLNNRHDVSDETKKKVQEIIAQLGYSPNSIARGLVLQRTYTIGLAIPDISNPFFPQVAKGVQSRAKELGYSVILFDTNNDANEEKEAIKLLKSKQVEGLIVSLSMDNAKELSDLEQEGFPVVQIDRVIPECHIPSVTIDNVASAYGATKYLIGLGHTRICHITGSFAFQTTRDRLRGYQLALQESNMDLTDVDTLEGDYTIESGYRNMLSILTTKQNITAVFAANDLMALGCYQAAFESGVRIPQDISIIGHDDIELSQFVSPPLTTMSQPKYELGRAAAENLIRLIELSQSEEDCKEVKDTVLETALVIRGSTASASHISR